MKRLIAFVTTRLLRSRIGLALLLAVVILGVVGVGRVFSTSSDVGNGLGNGPNRPITTVDPTAGNDGAISAEETPLPSTGPGNDLPEAVARSFATAWLHHDGVTAERWHASLVPHSTKNLADELSGVDPSVVPADRMTGDPTVTPRSESLVDVTVPVNNGRLRLQLVAPDGRWLVDEVDWEQE